MKKFLAFFILTVFFCCSIFSAAEAKSAEFKELTIKQLDEENFTIEAEFKGNLKIGDVNIRTGGQYLLLDIDNSTPGRISKVSGITNRAKDFVTKTFVGTVQQNQTRMSFSFADTIVENSVKFTIQPEDKKNNQPARLVVQFKKNVVSQSDSQNNFSVSRDVTDKVIVIDAGHGGSDSGARGHYGTLEKDVTLYVALRVQKLLTDAGAKVIMTRTTDKDVASAQASNSRELQARVDVCPPDTDIFISIHCNAFSNPNSNGMETYYYSGSPQSRSLAVLLNEELAKHGGRHNRGVRTANFYVLRHNPHVASLVELAFITNYEEENLLSDDDYQDAMAIAIVNAVKRYFNE